MSEFSSLPPGIFTSGSSGRKKAEENKLKKKQAEEKLEKDSEKEYSEGGAKEKEKEKAEESISGKGDSPDLSQNDRHDAEAQEKSGTQFPTPVQKNDPAVSADPGTEFPNDALEAESAAAQNDEKEKAEKKQPESQNLQDAASKHSPEEDEKAISKRNRKGRKKGSLTFALSLGLLCVQCVSGVLALLQISMLHMLPFRYIMYASAALTALLALTGLGLVVGRHRWQKIACAALSVTIALASCAAIWYASSTADFKKKSFSKARHMEMTTYLVIARKGRYTKAEQLKNKTVETGPESGAQSKALAVLQKKVPVHNVPVTGYDTLDCDLMKDRADAILIEDSATSILNETDKTFASKTTTLMKIRVPRVASGSAAYAGNGQPFTVFISGSDSRGGVRETARSDVDMLLTVNPKKRKVLMTSIPRDSFVTIHGKNAKDKLTHAGLLGIETLKATVHDFMKVKIDYYLKVNFTSVTTLVDELGGIDIYSDQDIKMWTYPKHQNKPLSKGWHHMDGKTALAFARERHSYKTGDRHRAENQQAVLKAIAGKLMSGKTLTNYAAILQSISSMFVTDIPDSLISDLVTAQLDSGEAWTFASYVIDCTEEMRTGGYFMPTRKLYYAIPVQKSVDIARNQIEKMRGDVADAPKNAADTSEQQSEQSEASDEPEEADSDSSDADNENSVPTTPITQQEAAL